MKGYREMEVAKEGWVSDRFLRETGADVPAAISAIPWPGIAKTTPVLETERGIFRRMTVFRATRTVWRRASRRGPR
jgi:hypothetical protein